MKVGDIHVLSQVEGHYLVRINRVIDHHPDGSELAFPYVTCDKIHFTSRWEHPFKDRVKPPEWNDCRCFPMTSLGGKEYHLKRNPDMARAYHNLAGPDSYGDDEHLDIPE